MLGVIVELLGLLIAIPVLVLLWFASLFKDRSYYQHRFRGSSYRAERTKGTFDID